MKMAPKGKLDRCQSTSSVDTLIRRISTPVETIPPSKRPQYTYRYEMSGYVDKEWPLEKRIKYVEGIRPPIPPNYPSVDMCLPNDKVLYVGKDAKEKLQYHYSKEHHAKQEISKVERISQMDDQFWQTLLTSVNKEMKAQRWSVRKLAAVATALLNTCFFRPGDQGKVNADSAEDPHFGITTLQVTHIKCTATGCKFEFKGKSGKTNTCKVDDTGALTNNLRALSKNKKDTSLLFQKDGHRLSIIGLRKYLSEFNVRPKDFRTYHANLIFVSHLRQQGKASGMTATARHKNVRDALKAVSEKLNNTPTVAKGSYVFSGLQLMYHNSPLDFDAVYNTTDENALKALLATYTKRIRA